MSGGRRTLLKFNNHFSGRTKELAKLHDALNSGGTAAVAQAISGLGGIGKTALAIAYAYQYSANYDYRLFCLADSVASLNAGYRAIASELALPIPADAPADDVVDAVKQWLETTPNYLLILDNADFSKTFTEKDLATFLPELPSGHILLTTRAQSLNRSLNITTDHVLKLDVMDPKEAENFLTEPVRRQGITLNEDEATAATELAKELGYLALALEQAAAFIAENGGRFRNYLNLFRENPIQQLAEADPQAGGYEKTVATTWQISFDEVERECPAATELLTLSAYLAPDDIPAEIVYAAAEGTLPTVQTFFAGATSADAQEQRYIKLLNPLRRYSLVTVEGSAQTYSIHRLVQAVVRHKKTDEEQTKEKRQAIEVVNAAFPSVEFERWMQCERMIPCAFAVTGYINVPECRNEITSLLLNQVGFYLNEQGRYVEAEPLYEEALKINRAALPYPHNDIAKSLNNLAALYESQGRYGEAEPLFDEALQITRAVLPTKHPDIAISLNNLAVLYTAQNRLDEAELLFKETVDIFQASLGNEHPNTKLVTQNLQLFLLEKQRHQSG